MLATLADHGGFIVTAHCPACGRATVLDLEILIFRYGADMPLEALRARDIVARRVRAGLPLPPPILSPDPCQLVAPVGSRIPG